jgi:serine/threonine protein kinase
MPVRQAPTLGELALKARLIRSTELEEALRFQRQAYLEGDFRRLGELLVDYGRISRPAVRRLLQRQGITIVECMLCRTRYNMLLFQNTGQCLRCGRRLISSKPHSPLTVEDSVSGGGAQADHLLAELQQRNPHIGRYEVLGEVGRGGMGVIYKARERSLQRTVALKFLRCQADLEPADLERFRREARAVASLKHPNIVQALAIEESKGLLYMAMDFIPGVPLDSVTNEGALAEREIVGVVMKIAQGLHYAHEQGLIHRDVKPANIVITRELQAFLVDFGVAKWVLDKSTKSLTSEGEVLGSLAYMAPEYVKEGRPALDRRCDVYGLGVVLYEAITQGLLPYGDPDDEDMILRLVKEPPIPLERAQPSVSPGLAKIVNHAIAKNPERRHPTAKALAEDLAAYLQTGSGVHDDGTSPKVADLFSRTSESITPLSDETFPSSKKARGRGPWRLVAGVLAVVSLLLTMGWVLSATRAGWERQELQRRAGSAELRAARLLEDKGDLQQAREAFDRAVELLPDDAGPLEERARVRDRLRDVEGAAGDRARAEALRGK